VVAVQPVVDFVRVDVTHVDIGRARPLVLAVGRAADGRVVFRAAAAAGNDDRAAEVVAQPLQQLHGANVHGVEAAAALAGELAAGEVLGQLVGKGVAHDYSCGYTPMPARPGD